jgi:hypothetical protein
MKQLLKGKSGLWLAPVFYVSRISSAITGPWSRGFPPFNFWSCPPFPNWSQGWVNLVLTVLFWAAVVALCAFVIKRHSQ